MNCIPKRECLVLYTTAICNLKCIYCYIDKSTTLKKIDDILDDSFQSDYYFEFSKQFYESSNDLKTIEFWGGEPSMGLHRVYHLLPLFINYYPNLSTFMMSTNFTTPEWFDEFYGFLKILEEFKPREFTFNLQLSIDGPEPINDENRGKGVTQLFLQHYEQLCNTLEQNTPSNVHINIHFKQTYSSHTISLLQDKQQIIDYFTFFDNLIDACVTKIHRKDIIHHGGIPNTATPGVHTVKDGKRFANYCKLTREIEKEHHFKYYTNITCYSVRPDAPKVDTHSYHTPCGHCGSGITTIGLLPNNNISLCHMGFTQLLEEYKLNCIKNHKNDNDSTVVLKELFINNKATSPMCMPVEEFHKIMPRLTCFFNHQQSTFQVTNLTALIRVLALTGQIESKYKNNDKALEIAHYYLMNIPTCIRDNINVTGSLTMFPIGLLKLLFNGAYEYIVQK